MRKTLKTRICCFISVGKNDQSTISYYLCYVFVVIKANFGECGEILTDQILLIFPEKNIILEFLL